MPQGGRCQGAGAASGTAPPVQRGAGISRAADTGRRQGVGPRMPCRMGSDTLRRGQIAQEPKRPAARSVVRAPCSSGSIPPWAVLPGPASKESADKVRLPSRSVIRRAARRGGRPWSLRRCKTPDPIGRSVADKGCRGRRQRCGHCPRRSAGTAPVRWCRAVAARPCTALPVPNSAVRSSARQAGTGKGPLPCRAAIRSEPLRRVPRRSGRGGPDRARTGRPGRRTHPPDPSSTASAARPRASCGGWRCKPGAPAGRCGWKSSRERGRGEGIPLPAGQAEIASTVRLPLVKTQMSDAIAMALRATVSAS